MYVEGEKTRLRPIEASDLSTILIWNNDAEVEEFLDGESPRTMEACREWFNKSLSNRHAKSYVILTREGLLLGDVELTHISWRSGDAELRIRIGEKGQWDKGLGTDAVRAILRHAFEDLSLNRVYLRVYSHNKRAIRVYTKCGFRKEGLLRHKPERQGWNDIFLMRILKSEYERMTLRSA